MYALRGFRSAGRTHPYIAGLHDWITSRSGTWLVLDWASEGDLFSYIHSRGCVPEATLGSQWTAQLVCALRHIHEFGVVHRDVKPENIIIQEVSFFFPNSSPSPGRHRRTWSDDVFG